MSFDLPQVNLPVPPTNFVGRALELHALVRETLAHRLVTVVGGFGMGKVRRVGSGRVVAARRVRIGSPRPQLRGTVYDACHDWIAPFENDEVKQKKSNGQPSTRKAAASLPRLAMKDLRSHPTWPHATDRSLRFRLSLGLSHQDRPAPPSTRRVATRPPLAWRSVACRHDARNPVGGRGGGGAVRARAAPLRRRGVGARTQPRHAVGGRRRRAALGACVRSAGATRTTNPQPAARSPHRRSRSCARQRARLLAPHATTKPRHDSRETVRV